MPDAPELQGARPEVCARSRGAGPDVVLVHGWALHGGVWEEVAERLAGRFRVTVVDLPGHGASAPVQPYSIESLADSLAGAVPGPALWVGWSLGGMVCAELAARAPERVRGLALVAASARFVREPGWGSALGPEVLEQFAEQLEQDYAGTLRRFLALQTLGAADGRPTLQRLRALMGQAPAPAPPALRGGLRLLREADLRPRLEAVRCPALVIAGERDTLVPVQAARNTAAALPRGRLQVIAGAGHAPFLSHADTFTQMLEDFLVQPGEREHG